MSQNLSNFQQLCENYHALIQDLDSDIIPSSSQHLANSYFNFAESLFLAFSKNNFSKLQQSWLKFQPDFEYKPFNFISLSLTIGDMDYLVKKSYLNFLLQCQHFVSKTLFDTFVYDLTLYQKNKEKIPPFILFVNWLDFPYTHMKEYFNHFNQNHFDALSNFNHLPELEFFINALFLRSKSEFDLNSFDSEYLNFNTEHLNKLNDKFIYVDVILKNNSINLPEQFVDYIKFTVSKFLNNPQKKQSTLETKEIKNFLLLYEKQKFDFLFPNKNIKFKTVKI